MATVMATGVFATTFVQTQCLASQPINSLLMEQMKLHLFHQQGIDRLRCQTFRLHKRRRKHARRHDRRHRPETVAGFLFGRGHAVASASYPVIAILMATTTPMMLS